MDIKKILLLELALNGDLTGISFLTGTVSVLGFSLRLRKLDKILKQASIPRRKQLRANVSTLSVTDILFAVAHKILRP